tara:strand:+ start:376 stop:831 length:456 start_codon:yes stop_codon:yes gene_type:complete
MPYDSSNKMKPMGPSMHKGGPHMESVKQERSNLLHDNPVAKDASGGRPWIAKHFKSSMSPLKAGHEGGESPMSKHDGKEFGDEGFMDSHFKSGKPREEGAPSNMNHDNSPASKYMSAVEKHCMGPSMSALEQEEEPKKMLVKKIKKKPKKA